jgi:hypothetical protein
MKSFQKFLQSKLHENMDPHILQKINAIKNNPEKFLLLPLQELQELVLGDFGIKGWEESYDTRALPALIDEIYESYSKVANAAPRPDTGWSKQQDQKTSLLRKLVEFLNDIQNMRM